MGESKPMVAKNRVGASSQPPALTAVKRGSKPLSEEEYSKAATRIDTLTKDTDELRSKIKGLETQFDKGQITAKQHDKLVKQYLLQLFDLNRELLPLKERIQSQAEEQERMRVRQKLKAMRGDEKKSKRLRQRQRAARETGRRVRRRRSK